MSSILDKTASVALAGGSGGEGMKEEPALSINITEKTFCLCMLAAQQLLNTINSKKSFRAIVERSPEAEKITIKIYTKDIPAE